MARDNHPRKRTARQLERKNGSKAGHDRILIVSEGTKTEPHYFGEIRVEFRLQTANVVIIPSKNGTEPLDVVDYAESLFRNGDPHIGIQARAFDQVFAVFDRDEHRTYNEALQKAISLNGSLKNDLRKSIKFEAVASVPSFEIWLLLHFSDIHAPIERDEALKRVIQHIPEYQKCSKDIFAKTKNLLTDAHRRAALINGRHPATNGIEPHTDVCNLVHCLTNLKS